MSGGIHNEGIIGSGEYTNVHHVAVGRGASAHFGASGSSAADSREARTDVAIITMLAVETLAIKYELGLRTERRGDRCVGRGTVGPLDVVATRTLEQGQRSIGATFEFLRREFNPANVVLAGIGGGIHPSVDIGDVVVATTIVYYDLRKETPGHTVRRGSSDKAPAKSGFSVNAFFSSYGSESVVLNNNEGDPIRVHCGPIGSGEAVVADGQSDIVQYLRSFNDKLLALDMEAGGLSQCVHELSSVDGGSPGWVVVRGISDFADERKRDDHQPTAATNAAITVRQLIPYLRSP